MRDPDGTLIALRTGGTSYYYLYDALGSITGLVNSAGQQVNSYRYDPYGVYRSKTEGVTNPYQYTGGYLDTATGLYKLGIRYYDPTLGRFTQQDPTGQDPHYTYALNSPCNFVDSTGAGSTTVFGNCGAFYVEAFETAAGNIRYDVQVAQNRRATSFVAKVSVLGGATEYRARSLFFRKRFIFGGNLPSPGGTNLLVLTIVSQPYGCTGQAIVDTRF